MASLEITESVGWPSPLGDSKFYTYVREERLFCAALAHLLLQRGGNLHAFLSLVNDRLPEELHSPVDDLDGAEVYLEFTYLRDSWFRLGRDNKAKRSAVLSLWNKVEALRELAGDLPSEISAFNSRFMGERGSRIRQDIVYPGQWSVESLYQGFGSEPETFRELCKFKWSFNIKPDLVIVLPGARPICVEAKLESKEGSYPASTAECVRFDEVFGLQQGRVNQF